METPLRIYLETGTKRVFAGALDWPGWCRIGRDEESAVQALLRAGPRYAQALNACGLRFDAPAERAALIIAERLPGNSTTDFGAPDAVPSQDWLPLSESELARLQSILACSWRALDAAAAGANGKTLRLGPRGGGRGLEGILRHVHNAERAYLSALGGKPASGAEAAGQERVRQAILEAVGASARGEFPAVSPRGRKHWPAAYFVRRAAWHVLDHVWEIEEREI